MQVKINRSLRVGLKYIASQQLPNGNFYSFCSQDKNTFNGGTAYQTTFFPSCIGLCLQKIGSPIAVQIKANIYEWLAEQKSSAGSFNYWAEENNTPSVRLYADDLDDTSCALAFLYGHKPDKFSGSMYADTAKLLFGSEVEEGGPYRTWLVGKNSDSEWLDVDPAVNANIAFLLSLLDVELPRLEAFISEKAASGHLTSLYYPDIYALTYFISRYLKDKTPLEVKNTLTSSKGQDFWGSPHNAALCLISLLNSGCDPGEQSDTLEYLLSKQQKDGSWSAGAFNIDRRNKGQTVFMGSQALTTALCLEAINMCKKAKPRAAIGASRPISKYRADNYYASVKHKVKAEIQTIKKPELRLNVQKIFKRIIARDQSQEIILLPLFITEANKFATLDKEILYKLSALSLWGWMAYTAHDDFLDETPKLELMPAVNYCMRQTVLRIRDVVSVDKDFQREALDILDRIDSANTWELANCRFPQENGVLKIKKLPGYRNYWQLHDRSLGHAIPSLGASYAMGYKACSSQNSSMNKFFKHYLAARQLNDEAHDWEQDLSRGHINAAASKMLKNAKGSGTNLSVDLHEDMEALRRVMWEETIESICEKTLYHVEKAKEGLKVLSHDFETAKMVKLLDPVEQSAKKTIEQRSLTLEFLESM